MGPVTFLSDGALCRIFFRRQRMVSYKHLLSILKKKSEGDVEKNLSAWSIAGPKLAFLLNAYTKSVTIATRPQGPSFLTVGDLFHFFMNVIQNVESGKTYRGNYSQGINLSTSASSSMVMEIVKVMVHCKKLTSCIFL